MTSFMGVRALVSTVDLKKKKRPFSSVISYSPFKNLHLITENEQLEHFQSNLLIFLTKALYVCTSDWYSYFCWAPIVSCATGRVSANAPQSLVKATGT